MNLRALAKKDAAFTVEGKQAGNTLCTLSDTQGGKWEIPMLLSDIGYSVDADGNKIAGRSCWATYRADRVTDADDNVLVPRKGWRLNWTDIDGKSQKMFVLFAEPDKTIGLTKLFMVVQLPKKETA